MALVVAFAGIMVFREVPLTAVVVSPRLAGLLAPSPARAPRPAALLSPHRPAAAGAGSPPNVETTGSVQVTPERRGASVW